MGTRDVYHDGSWYLGLLRRIFLSFAKYASASTIASRGDFRRCFANSLTHKNSGIIGYTIPDGTSRTISPIVRTDATGVGPRGDFRGARDRMSSTIRLWVGILYFFIILPSYRLVRSRSMTFFLPPLGAIHLDTTLTRDAIDTRTILYTAGAYGNDVE